MGLKEIHMYIYLTAGWEKEVSVVISGEFAEGEHGAGVQPLCPGLLGSSLLTAAHGSVVLQPMPTNCFIHMPASPLSSS